MDPDFKEYLIARLMARVSHRKQKRFEEVLRYRTRHIAVVLEDVFQSFNASAVLRTCDCFGIQDVHVIEKRNSYQPDHHVAKGAYQWLSLSHYERTADCFETLKSRGYQVVVTSPRADLTIADIDPRESPVALVFGTEMEGISDIAAELADQRVKIPMVGFSESFNISVSASVCLYQLTQKLWQMPESDWKLTTEEEEAVLMGWLAKSIRAYEQIEKRIYEDWTKQTAHD